LFAVNSVARVALLQRLRICGRRRRRALWCFMLFLRHLPHGLAQQRRAGHQRGAGRIERLGLLM
jgi:hypothetical protein